MSKKLKFLFVIFLLAFLAAPGLRERDLFDGIREQESINDEARNS